jgi:hypothetical protein
MGVGSDYRFTLIIYYIWGGVADYDGRLKSTSVCATDTPLQRKVKRANLTRKEVVGIIMYTGTLSNPELTSIELT